MIDIHSHILPGVDDGAKNLAESLAMGKLAVARGTNIMFATPHVSTRQELHRAGEIAHRVAALQNALDQAGIALRLAPGAEVYPMDGIQHALADGAPLTLNGGGRYLLLDSPLTALPMGLAQLVYDLQRMGVTPILAHPERVRPIQQNPRELEHLVNRGMLLQINASCLLGRHGDQAATAARTLLRLRWAHFISSDCHASTTRRPGLASASTAVADIMDTDEFQTLVEGNGRRIMDGDVVPTNPLPYTPERPDRWWKVWLKTGGQYVKRVCADHT